MTIFLKVRKADITQKKFSHEILTVFFLIYSGRWIQALSEEGERYLI